MALKIFWAFFMSVFLAFFLYLSLIGLPSPNIEVRKALALPIPTTVPKKNVYQQ